MLFRRHHGKVYALCWRLVGPDNAEDVTQEAFLRVLRYRRGFAARAQFTTWLYRIARNACVDHLRKVGRESEQHARYSREVVGSSTGGAESVEVALLEEALAKLPPDRREILVMSRFHDLSYAEIANICGCSEGAVKVRAHRALKHLRELFHEIEREHHGLRASQGKHRRMAGG